MMNVDELYEKYSTGKIDIQEFKKTLMELIYLNKFDFGLSRLNEDDTSEYILCLAFTLENIIERYNPELSSFHTYIVRVCEQNLFWWDIKRRARKDRGSFASIVSAEDDDRLYDRFYDQNFDYVTNESNISPVELRKNTGKVLYGDTFRLRQNFPRLSFRKNFSSEFILVLAIKSCYSMDDEMIKKVSDATGMSVDELTEKIQEAKNTLDRKKNRIERSITRRNTHFFFKKSLLRSLEEKENQDEKEGMEEKIRELDESWTKALENTSSLERDLTPTNLTVSRILGISTRRIARIISIARDEQEDDESSSS